MKLCQVVSDRAHDHCPSITKLETLANDPSSEDKNRFLCSEVLFALTYDECTQIAKIWLRTRASLASQIAIPPNFVP